MPLLLLLYFQAPDAAHLGELLFKCLLNFVSLSVEPFHFQDELVILPVIHHLLLHLALSHVQLVGEGELQLGWPFGRGGPWRVPKGLTCPGGLPGSPPHAGSLLDVRMTLGFSLGR